MLPGRYNPSMPQLQHMGDLQREESRQLSLSCTKALLEADSLNDYMELLLPEVGEVFRTDRVALVDYREQTDDFVLLYYVGYGMDARFALQRRLKLNQIRRALESRRPFVSDLDSRLLCIPFYFREILEAVAVLEYEQPTCLPKELEETAEVVSRTLGLLMSSIRLKVNQDQIVDMSDIQKARQIQLSYLPGDHPATEAYEIFGYNKSSALVGGDYFDYFRYRDGSIQCILADACGHGMSAALIVTTFRGLLHSEMGRREEYSGLFDSLNDSVHSGREFIQYLTGVFLDYNEQDRSLRYINAGHYHPIVFDVHGSQRVLRGGGPPLGMFSSSEYTLEQTKLSPGDLVVLFTDGLADIRDRHSEFFGVEGITAAIGAHREKPLHDLARIVLDRALSFGHEVDDDVTLFLMRVR